MRNGDFDQLVFSGYRDSISAKSRSASLRKVATSRVIVSPAANPVTDVSGLSAATGGGGRTLL